MSDHYLYPLPGGDDNEDYNDNYGEEHSEDDKKVTPPTSLTINDDNDHPSHPIHAEPGPAPVRWDVGMYLDLDRIAVDWDAGTTGKVIHVKTLSELKAACQQRRITTIAVNPGIDPAEVGKAAASTKKHIVLGPQVTARNITGGRIHVYPGATATDISGRSDGRGAVVLVYAQGTADGIRGGYVNVMGYGAATNIVGGLVDVGKDGSASYISGGNVYLSDGATASFISGGEVRVEPKATVIEVNGGNVFDYKNDRWVPRSKDDGPCVMQ